jgi:hypothetical protein
MAGKRRWKKWSPACQPRCIAVDLVRAERPHTRRVCSVMHPNLHPNRMLDCRYVIEKWSGRPGSNRRHPAWEAGVLPLNYSRPAC